MVVVIGLILLAIPAGILAAYVWQAPLHGVGKSPFALSLSKGARTRGMSLPLLAGEG